MSDLTIYLRWISRVRVTCSLGLIGSVVLGIMCIMGTFDVVLGIVLGVLSVVVLIGSIVGLVQMSWRVFEVEESFHQGNFNLTTTALQEGRPW